MPVRLRGQPAALIALRELTEQLMIEQMRSDFVANASHELRTPLAVVLGCIETLTGPARDDQEARERFLKIMAGEGARMTRLVDDLLSLSRIEQTEHQPPQSRVDPAACLDGVVETLRSYAAQRRVALSLRRDPQLPLVVGDRDQLVQLISNLIDNAIKYGGEGGKVEIACERVASAPIAAGSLAGRPAVRIVVADHGPGIAPEHLPRLTERFFRVDTARSRQLGGTGLGLAIVKHILRRHRGHLALESELGRGTTATVYLPVAETIEEPGLSSNRHRAVT
jgi:two-component system phosphate regulon sensor histidine kinase PhoR